jgi:hypothetical protein
VSEPGAVCERCGAYGGIAHEFTEGDCVLTHPGHAEAYVGLLCRRHYHWISETLTQILELYVLRGIVLLPGPGGEERQATRFGSPAPGRLAVMAISDKRNKEWRGDADAVPDVPGTLYGWIRLMAEERDDDDLADVNGDITTLIGVLKRERRWFATFAGVDDYVEDLGLLHRHVAAAVGDTMWPKPIGKCPNCRVALFNTIGVDEVTCRRCRSTWAGVALMRLRLIHEQEAKAT